MKTKLPVLVLSLLFFSCTGIRDLQVEVETVTLVHIKKTERSGQPYQWLTWQTPDGVQYRQLVPAAGYKTGITKTIFIR